LPRKFTYEFVKEVFESRGYTLVSTKYIGTKEKLDSICPKGHENSFVFESFYNGGNGCRKCGSMEMGKKRKVPYSDIHKMFEERGCKLLTLESEYKGVRQKVDYICSCGNPHSMSPDTFKKGHDCRECMKAKIAKTNLEKYGVECVLANKEIKAKSMRTMFENQTAPTSLQQKLLHEVLGGELNYPIKDIQLDIAFISDKIYIEYDGSGHGLKVKLGEMTEEEFEEMGKKRRYVLYRKGWKEIRIISTGDVLPTKEKIISMFEEAKNILKERSWILFDIDNLTMETSKGKVAYDYGVLKRIRTDVRNSGSNFLNGE
jgi:very-short-patch-repair endonuclease